MWWQDEADLYFFRPLAFFLIRLEYVVGGWRPAVMHGFSLVWQRYELSILIAVLRRLL
jgi:hypothetical protein